MEILTALRIRNLIRSIFPYFTDDNCITLGAFYAFTQFLKKKTEAADFAEYLTLTMSEELHALGGHYSVKLGENADATERMLYETYENSILVPDSQDAKEFWVTLKETISQYF